MGHDHDRSAWADPGGGDDATPNPSDKSAEPTRPPDASKPVHGREPSRARANSTDANAAAGSAASVDPPLGFSPEGLCDPDPVRREAAWLQFHSCYWDAVMNFLRRYEPDHDRREDLAQVTFIRAERWILVNGWTLRDGRKALPWLKKIARNRWLDVSDSDSAVERMLGMHGTHLRVDEELQTHAENALDRLEAEDPYDDRFPVSKEQFRARIAALSPRDQAILRLRVEEELEWDAVAKEVGMTPESARQRYHRLRERLREP